MKSKNANINGFSLIELIVVMGLISLILTLAFSIYTFSSTIFRDGNRQNDLQSETRLAIENLMGELRYATFIQLISEGSVPSTVTSSYEAYIFYDSVTDSLIKRTNLGDQKYLLGTSSSTSPLNFSVSSLSPYMISYSLSVKNGRQDFNISSNVSLLNIKQKKPSGFTVSETNTALRYQTPDLFISEMQYPDVMLTSINDDKILVLNFSKDVTIDMTSIQIEPGVSSPPKKQLVSNNVEVTSTSAKEITFSFKLYSDNNVTSFVDNDKIEFTVTFNGLNGQVYDAIYRIIYVGGSTKAWKVE